MALLNSDNQIGILIKSTADTKGIDQTSNSISGLEKQAGSGSKSAMLLGSAGKVAASGIALAGVAITAAGFAGVKSGMQIEMLRTNFDTLLGSAEKGRDLFIKLQNMAKITPFETTDLAEASQTLLAFGGDIQDLLPDLQMLGDIALGNKDKFSRLSLVYGQIRSAGRLMGQDLLQLVNVGFNPLQKMSERTGESMLSLRKKMEDGQISFEMVREEFARATAEGGQFFGGMEKGAKTLPGITSTIKDNVNQILRSLVGINEGGEVVDGGIFDGIKSAAEASLPVLEEIADKSGPAVIEAFKQIGKAVTDLWNAVGPILIPSVKALAETFKTQLLPSLMRLWEIIGPQLIPFIKILATIIGGILVANIWIFVNVANVMYKIIGFLINVFIEIGERVDWVAKIITRAAQSIYSAWTSSMNNTINAGRSFIGWISGVNGAIGNALGGVYHTLTSPFARAWDFISSIPARIVGSIGNVGNLLRNKIGDWDIPGPLGRVRDVIPGFATGVRNFSGGMAVVGERGPELVNLPRGADVFTNGESKAMLGGQTNNRTVSIGTVVIGTADAAKEFFRQLDNDMLLQSKGLTPTRGGA